MKVELSKILLVSAVFLYSLISILQVLEDHSVHNLVLRAPSYVCGCSGLGFIGIKIVYDRSEFDLIRSSLR